MLSKFEELKLIARCALSDDREAFGLIVESYQAEMLRFFLNLTGDEMLSDDLAQETFIKAYTGIRGFRGLSKFRTWLYRIAYNEFYSWMRSRKELPTESLPDQPVSSTATAETEMDIGKALGMLSEAERTATVLFYMEDRPIKEVAKITGWPEGTVKSHLHRAKLKLADFLGKN